MKIFNYILFLGLVLCATPVAAQIRFFEGTYDEALKKAREEKKDLFVDFYAVWCEPCKMMVKEVFTEPELAAYFNEHFVCIQLDVEAAPNKKVAARFKVEALPTLAFISRNDKELRRAMGMQDADALLREARIALGEELSFEQLYEKYRKNKKDFEAQQQLLIEAPAFMMTQEGYNRDKWSARIESLFPEYLKNKKLDKMINEPDFYILSMYHTQTSKDDPVFDFVVNHYDKFVSVLDTTVVARYLIGLNNSYIIQLCKQGNLAYKDRIGLVDTKLKNIYSGFSFGALTTRDAIMLLADATYSLYKHDLVNFFGNMNKYFAGKGEEATLSDYTQPLQELAIVYQGNMPEETYPKCIPWIGKALDIKEGQTPELRTRLLVMMGQCFQHTDNATKAKQSYNQAFLESAQIPNERVRMQMQQTIQQALQGL